MKNNKSGFTDKLPAMIILLFPVAFLVSWIWNVLSSGGSGRFFYAGIGGVMLISYFSKFFKINMKGFKRKEADPWEKGFKTQRETRPQAEIQRQQNPGTNNRNNNKKSSPLTGAVIILFMILAIVSEIKRSAVPVAPGNFVVVGFLLVMLVIIVKDSVNKKKDKADGIYTDFENNGGDYNSQSRQIRYFTEQDWENNTYKNKGIEFYCPYCDGKLEQNFEFCPHCGNKLHK